MISHWVLIYFAIGLYGNNGISVLQNVDSSRYTSQVECKIVSDLVNKNSGNHLQTECLAVAK